MTAQTHHRRRALLFAAALLAALLPVLAPQSALADDPPPVTVPTPTVPAPTPDTAPKRAPAPAPRYRPPATRSYSPPQYTRAPVLQSSQQPSTATGKPVTSRPKGTVTPSKHRVVPIVPIRTKRTPTYARAKFRPAASDRAPVPVRQRIVRSGNQSSALAWILPLVLALATGTALLIASRSHRARTHLSRLRLIAQGLPPRVLLRRLAESLEGTRELVAKVLPDVSAANAQRLIPQGALGRVEARLHHPALAEVVAAPVPLPVVASLEPVARLEALPEPEAGPVILATPPSPEAEDTAQAPPAEELCEITVWRGYTRSRFYARLDVAARLDAEGCAVAESTPFRFTGNGTLEQTEAAEAAHQALIEELVAQGWEPCDSVGPWYAARFSRTRVA